MEKLLERRKVKKKENKTLTEEMMLDYYKRLSIISEIIVSNSKCHLTDKKTIKEIKRILDVNSL